VFCVSNDNRHQTNFSAELDTFFCAQNVFHFCRMFAVVCFRRALWHGVAVQSSRGESAESRVDRGADGRASRSRKIPRLHAHEFYVRGQCRSLCALACKLTVTIVKKVFNVWRTGYD